MGIVLPLPRDEGTVREAPARRMADLAESQPPLGATRRCIDVYHDLLKRPEIEAQAVVDERGVPIGLVNRAHLLASWSRRFTPELFERKPITSMMDPAPFCIDAEARIEEVATAIADAHPRALSEGFIVTLQGRYYGMGTALALMRGKIDLTEFQGSEIERAREAAEQANRAKSAFLAQMSHELRTPLNAILGFSEVLQTQMFGPLGHARYVEYAGDIHTAGTHLLSLINDILDLAKAEAGKHELAEEWLDVAAVAGAVLRLIRPRAEQGGVVLEQSIAAELPPVRADERKLKQILFNLLGNAVKFTPSGGRVRLSAVRAEGGELVLAVADTGIGMRPEDVPRALMPFTQIDSRVARRYEGTGLGLPLVKSFVEMHGGRLHLASTLGAGTTAAIYFPVWRLGEAA